MTENEPTRDVSSPGHEDMELSPQTDSGHTKENSQVPMEISPRTPTTSERAGNSKLNNDKQKQSSWGERERTKNMRSSLEKDNETSGKLGGATKWKMVVDEIDLHSEIHKKANSMGKNPNMEYDKSNALKDKEEKEAHAQDSNGTPVYNSIWDPPSQSDLSNESLSKEGYSPNVVPNQVPNTLTTETNNKKEGSSVVGSSPIEASQSVENTREEDESWVHVKYKKSHKREQKQQGYAAKEKSSNEGEMQQERGRDKAKKKRNNAKGKTNSGNSQLPRKEPTIVGKTDSGAQQKAQEQISLQERVNMALATAASREEKRSQSGSRQAYLTTEGTVVRELQSSTSSTSKHTNKPTGEGQASQAKQDKSSNPKVTRGRAGKKLQQQ